MFKMKRPNFILSDNTKNKIASKIYNGFQRNFDDTDIGLTDIVNIIESANEYNNGYELAKELESNTCCDIDMLIVEVLDGIGEEIRREKEKMLIDWVEKNNIQPLFNLGDNVVYKNKNMFINGHYKNKALYKVGEIISSQSNWLVPYEKIEYEQEKI